MQNHTGKYEALWRWLLQQEASPFTASFASIEESIGLHLPNSCRRHKVHWRSYQGSAVARAIVDAGWHAEDIDIERQIVTFVRDSGSNDTGNSLRNHLQNQRTVWVTVDADGKAHLAVPQGPSGEPVISNIFGTSARPPWVDVLGSPLEPVLDCVKDIPHQNPGFMVLVSVPRETDGVDEIERQLTRLVARELDDFEYAVLQELGMDVPFGEWARADTARIFLLG